MTLETYRDLAEELLMNIADLANPRRVSNNWMMTKLEQWVSRSLAPSPLAAAAAVDAAAAAAAAVVVSI